MAESYRDLLVWQRSIQLSLAIYRLTIGFPKEELFGLTSQIRRAGVSVASNIAEGHGRLSTGEYRQFLGMARGSNAEIETQLVIAKELGYGNTQVLNEAEGLAGEVGKMLNALLKRL
ncbi:four helix bundle protein [Granulicella sp. dw_53]|uniref:four helix bundle protein n=1 Tax=Granulicella sp. dw_53 TaxID=2719792 RepID=UPI001BD3E5B0|nr:four helix bundle protein [Granulicella sp. dw_53]